MDNGRGMVFPRVDCSLYLLGLEFLNIFLLPSYKRFFFRMVIFFFQSMAFAGGELIFSMSVENIVSL